MTVQTKHQIEPLRIDTAKIIEIHRDELRLYNADGSAVVFVEALENIIKLRWVQMDERGNPARYLNLEVLEAG